MLKLNSKKQKGLKKEERLRGLEDNIHIIRVPEGDKRDEGMKNLYEEIISENFPNPVKKVGIQIQELHRTSSNMNPKRSTPWYMIIKISKIKGEEKIWKAAIAKQQVTYKLCKAISCSFSRNSTGRREQYDTFNVLKGKYLQPRILSCKVIIKILRRDKEFPKQT